MKLHILLLTLFLVISCSTFRVKNKKETELPPISELLYAGREDTFILHVHKKEQFKGPGGEKDVKLDVNAYVRERVNRIVGDKFYITQFIDSGSSDSLRIGKMDINLVLKADGKIYKKSRKLALFDTPCIYADLLHSLYFRRKGEHIWKDQDSTIYFYTAEDKFVTVKYKQTEKVIKNRGYNVNKIIYIKGSFVFSIKQWRLMEYAREENVRGVGDSPSFHIGVHRLIQVKAHRL